MSAPLPDLWGDRRIPPHSRRSTSYRLRVGARTLHVAIGTYPSGAPCELRVDCSSAKVGTELQIALEVWSRTVSRGLQHGMPLAAIAEGLRGVRDGTGGAVDADETLEIMKASSVWDAIGQALRGHLRGRQRP